MKNGIYIINMKLFSLGHCCWKTISDFFFPRKWFLFQIFCKEKTGI